MKSQEHEGNGEEMSEGDSLRLSFDEVAELYDEVRPGYPDSLINDAVALSGLPPGGQVLEVGCGTGQATIHFARRGYEVLGLELGESLATLARKNCQKYPQVDIRTVTFEEWSPIEQAFDLLMSAQAFHWIEPSFGCAKAAKILRDSGAIALFWNLDQSQHTDFWQEVQELYDLYLPDPVDPGLAKSLPQHVTACKLALERCEMFGEVVEKSYPWTRDYCGSDYMKLLNTHSNHRALPLSERSEFFAGIEDKIRKCSGTITRFYEARLLLAHRR